MVECKRERKRGRRKDLLSESVLAVFVAARAALSRNKVRKGEPGGGERENE
jgi:hypothetical protein